MAIDKHCHAMLAECLAITKESSTMMPPTQKRSTSFADSKSVVATRFFNSIIDHQNPLYQHMYAVSHRKALGQPLDLYDIRKFDAALGATLEKLYAAHKAHQAQGGSRKGPLLVDGCPIEDLCLTFVLPGYPEYELKKNGGDITVDASNVGSYITAVVDANLESGIKPQMDSFRLILLSLSYLSAVML